MSDCNEINDSNDKKLPAGAKLILPVEKVTEKVKKERSDKQKEVFEKMRKARDEANKKRMFSRQEALKQLDKVKIEDDKREFEERLKKAEQIRLTTGADVVVQMKRGRKPGQHIPYGGLKKHEEVVKEEKLEQIVIPERVVERVVEKVVYENPYLAMIRNKRR